MTTSRVLGPGRTRPASPRRPGSVAPAAAEVRWFVPGDVVDGLGPRGPSRQRTDAYHLASLGPKSSLKRRDGGGPLEWKTRIGRREPCEIAGVAGFAEIWTKRRLRARDFDEPLVGGWIDVHKRLWRVAGVEICHLEIVDEQWWTVALPTDRTHKAMRAALEPWGSVLHDHGECASYPTWVLARWPDR